MISKAKLKELCLYKTQKQCDLDNVLVVEGRKLCQEAFLSGWSIHVVCATEAWMRQHGQLLEAVEHYEVSDAELERLSGQKSPNEIWMLLGRPSEGMQPKLTGKEPQALTLAVDHLQDPGNMGTIIRTADWFGIREIVCSRDTVSGYNPKVVQSTMGGIFRTKITYTDLVPYLTEQKEKGRDVYGALLEGKNIYHTDLKQDAVLVIGNESRGISNEVAQLVTERLTIPNLGGTCESLNAAMATGILCSEILRGQIK